MRRDWLEIVAEISRLGMLCIIQSGGRAFTREKIQSAKNAGVSSIGISVDGLRETHDMIRGVRGSYDQAIRAIESARDIGLPTTVNTQVNMLSFGQLSELLDELIGLRIKVWQLQLTVAMGNAADNEHMLIQPFQIPQAHDLIFGLHQRAKSNGIRLDPGNNIGYFGPYEHEWRSVNNDTRGWGGCTAGSTSLGIESDGTIKGCPSLPRTPYSGGNVRDISISGILKSTDKMVNQQERTSSDLWGYCRTCYYADVCRGGCTWTSHVLFNRAGNNPYCGYRAAKLAKDGLRERIEKTKDAPGLPFDHGEFRLIIEDENGEQVSEDDPRYRDTIGDNEETVGRRLLLCADCREYVFDFEVACPHCKADLRLSASGSKHTKSDNRDLASDIRHYIAEIEARSKVIEDLSTK